MKSLQGIKDENPVQAPDIFAVLFRLQIFCKLGCIKSPLMQTIKWTDRKFQFGYEPGYLPLFIERLNGTVPRLKELVNGLSETALRYQPNGKWCIKQHIGHLTDLEELHEGRLKDFHSNLPVLRAADMSNRKTEEAGHNEKPLAVLISDFEKARKEFIMNVRRFSPQQISIKSFHPRLKEEISLADLLFFSPSTIQII